MSDAAAELRATVGALERALIDIETAPTVLGAVTHTMKLGPLVDAMQAAYAALPLDVQPAALAELAHLHHRLTTLAARTARHLERERTAWRRRTH